MRFPDQLHSPAGEAYGASPVSRPKRVQLSRQKGYRKPPGAVVVSRPSKWGNEWSMRDAVAYGIPIPERRAWLVRKYRQDIHCTPFWATEPRDLGSSARNAARSATSPTSSSEK